MKFSCSSMYNQVLERKEKEGEPVNKQRRKNGTATRDDYRENMAARSREYRARIKKRKGITYKCPIPSCGKLCDQKGNCVRFAHFNPKFVHFIPKCALFSGEAYCSGV